MASRTRLPPPPPTVWPMAQWHRRRKPGGPEACDDRWALIVWRAGLIHDATYVLHAYLFFLLPRVRSPGRLQLLGTFMLNALSITQHSQAEQRTTHCCFIIVPYPAIPAPPGLFAWVIRVQTRRLATCSSRVFLCLTQGTVPSKLRVVINLVDFSYNKYHQTQFSRLAANNRSLPYSFTSYCDKNRFYKCVV